MDLVIRVSLLAYRRSSAFHGFLPVRLRKDRCAEHALRTDPGISPAANDKYKRYKSRLIVILINQNDYVNFLVEHFIFDLLYFF
jgi:hypothetical protein